MHKFARNNFLNRFGEHYAKLEADEYADPEDRDEYTAENIFYVPKEARWSFLQSQAKSPEIGKLIDDGMSAIEKENPSLKGLLLKKYGKPSLDKRLLGEPIDLIATIGLGDKDNRSQDILGRVYEFFLGKFASAEGKNGGQFYNTQIPACLWFLTRSNKGVGAGLIKDKNTKRSLEDPHPPLRNRQGETLFIDVRKMSFLVDRVHRELTEEEITRIPKAPKNSRFLHNQRLGKVLILDSNQVQKYFLYYLLRTNSYLYKILASATGTTVKHTSPERIKAFNFLLPSLPEQKAIAQIILSIRSKN
jgi:type I restriction-modification system DNA methylase subunit